MEALFLTCRPICVKSATSYALLHLARRSDLLTRRSLRLRGLSVGCSSVVAGFGDGAEEYMRFGWAKDCGVVEFRASAD